MIALKVQKVQKVQSLTYLRLTKHPNKLDKIFEFNECLKISENILGYCVSVVSDPCEVNDQGFYSSILKPI